ELVHTRSEWDARDLPPPRVRMKQRAGLAAVQPCAQRLGVDSRVIEHQNFCSGRTDWQFGPNGGWTGEGEQSLTPCTRPSVERSEHLQRLPPIPWIETDPVHNVARHVWISLNQRDRSPVSDSPDT